MLGDIDTQQVQSNISALQRNTPKVDFLELNQFSKRSFFLRFCQQIQQRFNIPCVDFYRFYRNEQVMLLTNQSPALEYFYSENVYPYMWSHQQSSHEKSCNGYITWALSRSEFSAHQHWITQGYIHHFGVEHGYTIITHQSEYTDYLSVYEKNRVGIYSLPIYHIQKLYQFFIRTCTTELNTMQTECPKITPHKWEEEWLTPPIVTPCNTNDLPSKIALTPRERECIHWLLEGKTAEETAIILGLARKTVESYFENIRNKLNCTNKYQIIRKVIESYLT